MEAFQSFLKLDSWKEDKQLECNFWPMWAPIKWLLIQKFLLYKKYKKNGAKLESITTLSKMALHIGYINVICLQ